MIHDYSYTKSELEQLLKSIVVLIDTREQQNKHIKDYFDQRNIQYKEEKLDYGDYSFILPANKDMGIAKNISFKDKIVVERKASLEELSGNLTQRRSEFENELLRASKSKLYLLIEQGTYADILHHRYNTKYDPKAFVAALKTYETRYNLDINYIGCGSAGNFIYNTFYYFLREHLKGGN